MEAVFLTHRSILYRLMEHDFPNNLNHLLGTVFLLSAAGSCVPVAVWEDVCKVSFPVCGNGVVFMRKMAAALVWSEFATIGRDTPTVVLVLLVYAP